MAEEQPQSIADRIAALKLNQVGRTQPPSYEQATNNSAVARPRPPPPPRPALPARPANPRTNSSNVPPVHDHTPLSGNGRVGNLPERGLPTSTAQGMDGISRPALPPRTSTQPSTGPVLPPRRPSEAPSLPSRQPSETPSAGSRRPSDYGSARRGSNESVSSIATARSGISAISTGTSQSDRYSIRAPTFDPASLPALPSRRTQEEKEAEYKKFNSKASGAIRALARKNSAPNVSPAQIGTTPPPALRSTVRQVSGLLPVANAIAEEDSHTIEEPRQRTIAPPPRKSALLYGLSDSTSSPNGATTPAPAPMKKPPPVLPTRPGSTPQTQSVSLPPPIPSVSKPDLASLQALKPKLNGTSNGNPALSQDSCLICRDYSGPDDHAARYSRETLPSLDVGWLAQALTNPFSSHTDKARALFTWLHHNIAYDTVAFYGNNVKPSTPNSTLQSGLAVCEGYAGLFAAFAVKAGLEAIVVSGHGKGYGYVQLKPGDPVPPYSAGHAWNAVKIDGGQWKLIDCCWGAGAVSGANQPYQKRFAPERFTQSNEDFGLDHFPGDANHQFRIDGRSVTWEEYITGGKRGSTANFFSGLCIEEGLYQPSFKPAQNPINVAQQMQIAPTIRFSFQKCCPHWDPVRNGKGPYYMYLLNLDGLKNAGAKNDIPFQTNGDVWWCDVSVKDLGPPGGQARIYALTVFNGEDARGFPREKWLNRIGSWGYGGVCSWDLA